MRVNTYTQSPTHHLLHVALSLRTLDSILDSVAQLSSRCQLQNNVTATQQLTAGIQLRICWPVAELLEALTHLFVFQYVK